MSFNVKKHLLKVQGGKEYLPVAYRLVWFREEHPSFGIETSPIICDVERGVYVWHARITDESGRVVAEGTKMETVRGFADAAEKSETGAIGRALGVLGYGTQWALDDFDEGERIVDSPVPIGPLPIGTAAPSGNGQEGHAASKPVANIGKGFACCAECNRPLTKPQETLSTTRFGKPLCPVHQPKPAAV